MKSALRLLKGSLVEGIEPTINHEENYGLEEVNFNKNESIRRSRTKSRSKPRFESRSFQGGRSRERSESRNRGRSRNRYNQKKVREDIEVIAKAEEETKVMVGEEILAEKDITINENHMSMLTLSLKKTEKKQKLKLMKTLTK